MVELPSLPDPDKAFSIIDRASGVIDKGLNFIDKIEHKLDQLGISESKPTALSPSPSTPKVTDQQTLIYQLEHILAPLRQLELHLAEKGTISGIPCDCIAKAASDVLIFSDETIPIAARQGANPKLYDELADWARHISAIGNEEAVRSGKYTDEYLVESGNASRYRKQIQSLLSQVKAECDTCEAVKTLKEHLENRRKGR